MNLHEELVERLAQRRSAQLGGLSSGAYNELLLAVREKPETFIEDPADQAFALVVQAVDRVMRSRTDDDLRDDAGFMEERKKRMERLRQDCAAALAVSPDSVHARLLLILAQDKTPDAELDDLLALEEELAAERGALVAPEGLDDAWLDGSLHGRMRLYASIARTCLDSARYRMADRYGQQLISASPSDVLGARHTCALCLARLEEEDAFDALDARFSRKGDSWVLLARAILLYKLGRRQSAHRAAMSFARLCEGGPYALMRPVMVDSYLPDRPEADTYSFAEVTLAVHEADPVICDVPDFCSWAEEKCGFGDMASSFAERNGFAW